jgi:hypothetical protein
LVAAFLRAYATGRASVSRTVSARFPAVVRVIATVDVAANVIPNVVAGCATVPRISA